jgi:hydroxyethylthiazole kinase
MALRRTLLNLIRVMPAEGWERALQHSDIAISVLRRVRAERPLVHNITNFVVMNVTANALLAVGASPAMVHAPEEAKHFAVLSRSLVINIGTLDDIFVDGMRRAAKAARRRAIPWVLDPVGVGATRYRQKTVAKLLKREPAVIRANASEIIAMSGAAAKASGVDAGDSSESALAAAEALHKATGAVVAVTGATDYVVSGEGVVSLTGGHALSQAVTGTGCITTALVGACLAVAPPRDAAIAALALMKAAAEAAAEGAAGPGSFAVALIDRLAALSGGE